MGQAPDPPTSPFLAVPESAHLCRNELAFAIRDRFPVSPGHTLVVPFRVVPEWWDATAAERAAILELVDRVRADLLDDATRADSLPGVRRPDGFNVGFNAGAAAGQTVEHLHLHVIPRYRGDMDDPRGGIRHAIPEKGNYLASPIEGALRAALELHDSPARPLGPALADLLDHPGTARADLVVSFVMVSGLELLGPSLDRFLDRGGSLRILTSDYLGITEKEALARLQRLAEQHPDRLRCKVFRAGSQSFHPKAYLLWGEGGGRAFVGSANLSRPGLLTGVEWTGSTRETASVDRLAEAFEDLWDDARAEPLTAALVESYVEAERTPGADAVVVHPPEQPYRPSEVQREALDALEATRAEGYGAGLVVMATGLGKTWLAAFDSSRPQMRRVLFLAHREEILTQARAVFRKVRPNARVALWMGNDLDPDADVVVASIQTVANRLRSTDPGRFDYIVVDEFHHAEAPSYRRVIGHFDPRFLLGLTATPDRADGADLLALCEDNLVYECGLADGIGRGLLSPFQYHGVPDTVDFRPLPWRNGRFDESALESAVVVQERIAAAHEAWAARRRTRTLGFCVSTRHADVMAQAFRDRGVRAVAVHSGQTSAPRHASIDQLERGELDVVFAVDMFNEGLDVPLVDTVLMLRPTTSPVVFLQQLGRGLRRAEGKSALVAIDFIGNHATFLTGARVLAGLSGRVSERLVRQGISDGFVLPEGCSAEYELEAKERLLELLPVSRSQAMADFVLGWTAEHGRRPTAVEAKGAGMSVNAVPGHWFGFLAGLEVLDEDELEVLDAHEDVLKYVAKMSMTKSFKAVALRAFALEDIAVGQDPGQLAARSLNLMRRDPQLRGDVTAKEVPDLDTVGSDDWAAYWRKWPLTHLAKDSVFRLTSNGFALSSPPESSRAGLLADMIGELVDWQLARYHERRPRSAGHVMKVSHSSGNPILRFDREKSPGIPEGPTPVRVDGRIVEINFVKIAANTATEPGIQGNALHPLLRGWFGPRAGLPGTERHVILRREGADWVLEPVLS